MGGDSLLESCKPPPGLHHPAYNVYIDNISVFGQGKSQTDRIANEVFGGIESVGFRVHERAAASKWAVTLGLEIDFLHSTVQGKRQKRWKLKSVLGWLASHVRGSGQEIEWLLGHSILRFGSNRLFLSIFNNAYGFIRVGYCVLCQAFGKTFLHLGDSMTAIVAFVKGRAKHKNVFRVLAFASWL